MTKCNQNCVSMHGLGHGVDNFLGAWMQLPPKKGFNPFQVAVAFMSVWITVELHSVLADIL